MDWTSFRAKGEIMTKMKLRLGGIGPCIFNNKRSILEAERIKAERNKIDHAELDKLIMPYKVYRAACGNITWPGYNMQKMLMAASLKTGLKPKRGGKKSYWDAINSSVFVDDLALDQTDEDLIEFEDLVNGNPGKAKGGSTVKRTRPMLKEWSGTAMCEFDADEIPGADLIATWQQAGRTVGLSDYRPRFGRFGVEVLK